MSPPDPNLERLREQEFYRYYEPLAASSALGPPYVDLYDPAATAKHQPHLAPDEVLTSLCHLGALQFGAARCMLFFFDQDNVYILAEATNRRFTDDAEDAGRNTGGLWLGSAVIPRGLSVCEHTINIPAGNEGSNQDRANAGDVHVINDLREDVRFCDRSFVTDGPRARFYAGVPITTPHGVRIGVYCVLDDQPRNGISDGSVEFLKHTAGVVMTHLENRRVNADIGRGARMLRGLGSLVQQKPERAHEYQSTPTRASTAFVDDPMTTPMSEQQNPFFAPSSKKQHLAETSISLHRQATSVTTTKKPTMDKAYGSASSTPLAHAAHQPDFSPEGEIPHSFQKAADIISHAMELDGVAFLDTVPKQYGAAVDINRKNRPDRLSNDGLSGRDTDGATDDDQRGGALKDRAEEAVTCGLLGFATRSASPEVCQNPVNMTVKFLQALSQRHPRGNVWLYSSQGSAGLESSQHEAMGSVDDKYSSRPSSGKRSARRVAKEASELQRLLPGVRSFCFVPMWDPLRDRWYAGAMTWSYSRHRILHVDSELNYMRAFCNILMGEIVRLESKKEDNAKSALISSVSHELRSPLHGILGSIDLLEGRKDSQDSMLIQQMEKCGVTLLAVVDHLLDFAEINHHSGLVDNWRRGDEPRGFRKEQQIVSLSAVTEDVADTVYYSHCLDADRQKSRVQLILDLLVPIRYHCRLAVGAWKRLLTNIIGNALKYTPEGHARITLVVSPRDGGNSTATLTVSDTGIGMAADFLQNRLFRPFTQEDPLTVGTGLGMSIVSQLVRGFGGNIQVQSEKDIGTTVTITIPLMDAPSRREERGEQNDRAEDARDWNVRMAFPLPPLYLRSESPPERVLIQESVERTYRRLGIELCSSETANVWTIFESDRDTFLQGLETDFYPNTPPCVVLCNNMRTLLQNKGVISDSSPASHFEFVLQPYGPQRMQAAVRACAAKSGLLLPRDQPFSIDSALTTHSQAAASRNSHERAWWLKSTARTESTPAILVKAKQEDPTADSLTNSRLSARRRQTADDEQEVMKPAGSNRKLHLMLVDDNPINLKLLVAYASRNKHSYVTATNGQEAIQAYQQASDDSQVQRPDVIFLDLNMPVMDGFEAACGIREHERDMKLPASTIVAVTALGDLETQQKAHSSGIDRFMKKPARSRDLSSVLNSVVELGTSVVDL